jgi:hypothetical protein
MTMTRLHFDQHPYSTNTLQSKHHTKKKPGIQKTQKTQKNHPLILGIYVQHILSSHLNISFIARNAVISNVLDA